ncbi:N-acetylmannosamine-6-phosphate 2-epimerase [Clostridium botulinum]|uniref:Putative N-acetylmannosamine-6-phosphate 2-epimerase n=1 Tax=Clostridium botulinum D str. 1873 TaxID=592027 RepID=A0A9P2LLE2_CLOBO|nr:MULTISPECIES: N-acetylmannosamine-6-phosphate 2-epimerase [Clostridium]EES91226.1 putative N-acetylmannosamine-6-P epimerase [Clostridium botulinum D str. 1873]MBO3441727.1 N-acetylmannosamine-6-phosphate 2-epimerase [Clostridium haemolyticum]MCD3218001.1 N-acetylmannosamine-6-phosphate 2-epimerase [Clostridium botulinum C]MCD3246224.1 N-acetylmannosamine-6-phosphate 2-epimerase [Clostridium botulinum C]MCD3260660.1 N-acetylmannosamine-6-phosphate 2-epimerase [Clostridium botulinum C]
MLKKIRGKLIVSCQALENEPLHSSFIMGRMALAAKMGGAAAIRAQSAEDIKEIKKVTGLPVIGLVKRNYEDSDIYITPTKKEIDELLTTECEIIALDATTRKRPNSHNLKELVDYIHKNKRLVMGDISTIAEGINAEILGVDCVSTTLSGYTPYSKQGDSVDLEIIEKLSNRLYIPVIGEGKISTPSDLKKVFECGAYAAVVGGAITRPQLITAKFVDVINSERS